MKWMDIFVATPENSAGRTATRMTRAWRAAFFLAGLWLILPQAAHAQNTGRVFGTVVDDTGAVVRRAHVQISAAEYATRRAVTSNGVGDFSFDALPIGTYTITVTSDTFKTYVMRGIHVDAGQEIKEVIQMHAGLSTESLNVEAPSTVIDTSSGSVGALIDNKLIENLPLDGNNVVALAALLPGVVDVYAPTFTTSDTGGSTFSANGGRNNQNLMLFDGLMYNNLFYNTGIHYPPHAALQEVSVILSNYKAEYGRSAGSIFNVITKSGTNHIHGQVWEELQNQMFNASDYVTGINPRDNYNLFGGTIGAPLIKDRLFIFGAFQQLIGRLQVVESEDTAPSWADRGFMDDGVTPKPCASPGPFAGMTCANFTDQGGNFHNPIDPQASSGITATQQNTIDMVTNGYHQAGGVGAPPCLAVLFQAEAYQNSNLLPTDEIPTVCFNPVSVAITNKYVPVPNALDPNGNPVAESTSPSPTFDENALIRVDYHLARHTIDARYSLIHTKATATAGADIATFNPDINHANSQLGSIGDTWIITPNLLNVIHVGYKRYETGHLPTDNSTLATYGGVFNVPGIPTMPAIAGGYHLGKPSQGYQNIINENFELQDQMSWVHGKHNFAWGFNFLRLQYLNRSDYSGSITYNSTFTRVSLADNLMGLVNNVQAQSRLIQGGIQHDVFMYFQDDWRATRNLTLNVGLRYELPFQWFEPHGQSATFIPGIHSVRFPGAPGGLGFPGDPTVLPSLVPTDFNGIAPRFGFSYDVTGKGKFLIRGGGGIFFDAVNANVVGVGEPFHYQFYTRFPSGGGSNPLLGFPAIPATFDPQNPQFIPPYSIYFPDRNFRTPYVEAFNIGIMYKVPHGGSLQANYIGRLARKLTIPLDLNPDIYDCSGGYFQANPSLYCTNAGSSQQSETARVRYADFNYGGQGIIDILSVGTGNYHALQMHYSQHGGHYLTMTASYTFAKSIDLQSNGQTTSNSVPNVFNIKSDRGLSDFNTKHAFSLGWTLRLPKVNGSYAFVRAITNNWIYSGKYLARTGHPFSVIINDDRALNGEPNQRAALLPGVNPLLPSNRHRVDKMAEWFNINAFQYPTVGTLSTAPRNMLVGPAYITTDMNVGREFPMSSIRQGMRVNFRVEAFNVFNTPNLSGPNASFSCSDSVNSDGTGACLSFPKNFGKITHSLGANNNTQTTARKLQFALTIYY